jgi:uncharacterized membrane protein YgaE (UPF0421/DUF939 family)
MILSVGLVGGVRRAQPTAITIIRLTVTAVVAFSIAHRLTGDTVLAPLTALIVVQVTLYHTFTAAVQRVISVTAGVVVAVGLSRQLGFTWWSLGITVALALVVGNVLRLGNSVLEVPISAMLILALPTQSAVTGRILATLIGAAVGLVSNLVVAPLRVKPAEEAVDDLSRRLADLLDDVARDLSAGRGPDRASAWLERSRVLTEEAERVEDTLGQAEESVRLNPRGPLVADPRLYLRRRLETLEGATLTIRGIARSLNDSAGLSGEVSPLRDAHVADRIAGVLRELAAVLRPYGRLARSESVDRDAMKAEVDRRLAQAEKGQREVAELLRGEPAAPSAGWPLRGELVSHLDRLRTQLAPPPPRPSRRDVAAADMRRHPVRRAVGWVRRRRGERAQRRRRAGGSP